MVSSGQTAIQTTDDNPINLIGATEQSGLRFLCMMNEEGLPGYFSVDGGKTWCRWPDGAKSITLKDIALIGGQAIQFKRPAGGTNVVKLYAWGY